GFGAIVGLTRRPWRRETVLLLLWIGTFYVVFANIWAMDSRYLLPVCPALVCLCVLAWLAVARATRGWFPAILIGFLLAQAWMARGRPIPCVNDFNQVVAFVERVAPAEPVVYDGCHDGVFIFLVQAGDPDYRRQVVLGNQVQGTDSQQA